MSVLVTAAWSALVLLVGSRVQPRRIRRPHRVAPLPAPRRAPPALLVRVGLLVHRAHRRVGHWVGRDIAPCTDPRVLARMAVVTAGLLLVGAVAPPVALLVVVAGAVRSRAAARRRATTQQAAVRRELPDTVELLAIAISSGANLTQAIGITVASLDGCVAAALRDALAATHHGVRMVDALRILPERLGPAAQPLVTALVLAERHGTPLVHALRQLALELRDQRRRHAEETARRVPIRLLAPLILLLLPAFALLTVAPLLAGGLRSLRL